MQRRSRPPRPASRPGAAHALRAPARTRRLPGEPVARHRRNDEMERVLWARAVRRRIGEPTDELQLLDDRAGPSMVDDQGQGVLVLRANVDEMDVEAVHLRDELRQRVQRCLASAPVVVGRPVTRELLHRRERHALRVIRAVSFSGHCVAAMRARRSSRSASAVSIVNWRIVVASADLSAVTAMWVFLVRIARGQWSNKRRM